MSDFFKMLFASCLGVALGLTLLAFIGIGIIGAAASKGSKPKQVESNSVLHLTFSQVVPEMTNNVEMQSFTDFKKKNVLGLTDIVAALNRAAEDDRVKGIFLETDMAALSGFATVSTLRQALEDFKKSGKFIVSHGKFYFQGNYHLCSVADELYINPLGISEIRGYSVQIPFYKNMIDRLGINMQIYYAGKFKGATEPLRLEKLSEENRFQYRELLKEFYNTFLEDVSSSRKMESGELRRIVDNFLADSPENAVKYGLIDEVLDRDEALSRLRKKLGQKDKEKVKLVSLETYAESNPENKDYKIKDKIAVLYAEGGIQDGKGANGSVGDDRYTRAVDKILKDDKIKAIVLRVNSPGGSAIASENILAAINRAKAAGKPIVVSMGDYAASGGYYIACQADSIFAEPNTVTGSIGVFSVIPSLEKAMQKNLGIRFDSVNTGPFAGGLNVFFDQSPEEARKLQTRTEEMYSVFLKHVAKGRDLSTDSVNTIAQGRVWTGRDALRIGLVDKLGGMDDALASAAKLAKLKSYRVVNYPQVLDPFQELLNELTGQGSDEARMGRLLKTDAPELYPIYREWVLLRRSNGVQARMPFMLTGIR